MTGSMRDADKYVIGTGSSSGFDPACGHDETELHAAAAGLAKAQEAVEDARAFVARAEDAEWSGPAAAAFRTSTACLAARMATVAAGLAALALMIAALQSEVSACPRVPIASRAPSGAASPQSLVAEGRTGPLVPLPSRTPALRLSVQPQPAFTQGLGPREGRVCP
ncbi:hypothetical protein GCM10027449_09080 [Sinomonas notoginsengisoli]|uniref:hypothetical protein n=1 Tax=Sinomonas notoginsengisoli TaxID=1457311 RepID=UPI001F3EC722|nr:hypothetical protein [Sinomonas notoginsengisoli]